MSWFWKLVGRIMDPGGVEEQTVLTPRQETVSPVIGVGKINPEYRERLRAKPAVATRDPHESIRRGEYKRELRRLHNNEPPREDYIRPRSKPGEQPAQCSPEASAIPEFHSDTRSL